MTDVEDMSTGAESLDREEIGGGRGGGRRRGGGRGRGEAGDAAEVGAWRGRRAAGARGRGGAAAGTRGI